MQSINIGELFYFKFLSGVSQQRSQLTFILGIVLFIYSLHQPEVAPEKLHDSGVRDTPRHRHNRCN